MTRMIHCAALLAAACLTLPAVLAQQTDKPTPKDKDRVKVGTTLENLQTAFQGESNARAMYLEFARKADQEGYAGVGSLFRAAARAEGIHADAHAAVIRKLGGTAKPELKPVTVGDTRANLETALRGENYERQQMYPEFLARAKADKDADAIRTFNYAKTAEAEHAKLYEQALKNLDQWKAAKRDFFVCTVCGYTVAKLDFKKCPACFSPADKYETVN